MLVMVDMKFTAETAALVLQGVTDLMEVRRPCNKLEGVGSSHVSKLFSSQSIMASPFLKD